MWSTPFDESMLFQPEGIVILCTEKDLAYELFDMLKKNRIYWVGEKSEKSMDDIHWDDDLGEKCYRIYQGHGGTCAVKCGSRDTYEYGEYSHYPKCTFFGAGPEFEAGDEKLLLSILGIER